MVIAIVIYKELYYWSFMEKLVEGLKQIGIAQKNCRDRDGVFVDDINFIKDICAKIEKYINEIILFNSAYNLTNTSDHDELVVRHILDSLSTYKIISSLIEQSGKAKQDFKAADIGSGGGLPGIPLATVFSDIHFDLIERMSKRCAFLENCSAIMGLKKVNVICKEAEKVSESEYDLITFRAFRPLDKKMIKTLLKIVKKDGVLCAYKAKIENITQEMNEIADIIPEYQIEKLQVPFLEDAQRNLVIIKK